MNSPVVTIGMPVYRVGKELLVTLECIRAQTYPNLDILISVDAGDMETARACEPFLRQDPRIRMHVQPERLGWAGNTDWTMRERRGDFYVFQQHDDQVSPTYVADLVEAALRRPDAAICFSEIQETGLVNRITRGLTVAGSPTERLFAYLETMDCRPFRGLIRGSALASTSGLLLSGFDPFDSYGTEIRFMAELLLAGEFQLVAGPSYYKRMHGENLHLKRWKWSEQQKQLAWACLGAWMMEVVPLAGRRVDERQRLAFAVLDRFLRPHNPWEWLRIPARHLASSTAGILGPLRSSLDHLKANETLVRAVSGRWMMYEPKTAEDRIALLHLILDQLRRDGRFKPDLLGMEWEAFERQAHRRLGVRAPQSSAAATI